MRDVFFPKLAESAVAADQAIGETHRRTSRSFVRSAAYKWGGRRSTSAGEETDERGDKESGEEGCRRHVAMPNGNGIKSR